MTNKEAIKLLSMLPMTVLDADFSSSTVAAINMAIEALQERPKGRWVEAPNKIWSHEFKCSCCGRSVYTMIGEKGVTNWYPYCHCGADMRGEEK